MNAPASPYTLYHFFRERYVLPLRQWIFRVVRQVLVIFIVAMVMNFLFSYFFYTPKMHRLRQQNDRLVERYQLLDTEVGSALEQLRILRERDHAVYRAIFGADTLAIAGVYTPYPDTKYASVGYGRYKPLMTEVWRKMDALGRQLYLQSVSLDQVEEWAADKDLMAEVVPAIMPIDPKKLRGNIGAFGARTNPVTLRFQPQHKGIDLTAPKGTPIYASGTGLVVEPRGVSGYGNQVMIDHGFGYTTRYAHLSMVLVKVGQLVRRGEVIGLCGSTGRSSGTHLHYEVIYRGNPVNPINYLSRNMSEEEFNAIVESAETTPYEHEADE